MRKNTLLLISTALFATVGTATLADTKAQDLLGDTSDFAAIPTASTKSVPRDFAQFIGQPIQIPSASTQTSVISDPVPAPVQAAAPYYYFSQPATQYGNPIPQVAPVVVPRRIVRAPIARPTRYITQPSIRFLPLPRRAPIRNYPSYRNYLSLKGFYSQPSKFSFNHGTFPIEVESDPGYAVIAAIGRRFGYDQSNMALRLELEGAYRRSKPESMTASGVPVVIKNASTISSSLMVNALAEFKAGRTFRPYFGAGIGGAYIDHSNYESASVIMDDQNGTVAYQGIIGANIDLGNNIDFILEGRHFRAADVERTTQAPTTSEDDFAATEFGLGLNFNF